MISRNIKPRRPRPGFTLIELLTVVAIISLLMSILLPSLSRARDQAKRAAVAGMLKSIDGGLEMFYNDFNRYPDSSLRPDPIDWEGEASLTNSVSLSGAHWLARALVGHDAGGLDAEGIVMRGSATPLVTRTQLLSATRKGVYMEGPIYARDNDEARFTQAGDFVPTGRPVVFESHFGSPVIYYRANTRAQVPFADSSGVCPETGNPGTYSQQDNYLITGAGTDVTGWDFAYAGRQHQLALFGPDYSPLDPDTTHTFADGFNNSFVHYLHSETAHKTAQRVRPVNAERFILITAGKDGLYGTDDDVTNFENGN